MNYQDGISIGLEELKLLRSEVLTTTQDLISNTLFMHDVYFSSLLNRCLAIIDGSIVLIEKRNLLCFGALLRLQLDNCLRTYAGLIIGDISKLQENFLNGKKLSNLSDTEGHQLTDSYLLKHLSKYDAQIEKVYKECSGYIHHSEKAFFATARPGNTEGSIKLNIGHELDDDYDKIIFEGLCAEKHYIRLQLELCSKVIEFKIKFEDEKAA